jgi:site-specific recombinase XerD
MTYLKEDRDNNVKSRARKVACLKAYFKYLKKAKLIKENIAEELETPKIHYTQPEVLSAEESIELLKSLDKTNKNYARDYCILTLFLNCVMRLSELNNIKLEDIKEDVLTIIGKGQKERKVYLNKSCLKALSQYLNIRDDSKCSLANAKFLFISSQNKKISKRRIEGLVTKHLSNANFDINKLHTHSMRASFATMNYKNGADIATLAKAMGHVNINTTKLYLNIDEDDLRRLANDNPLTCI